MTSTQSNWRWYTKCQGFFAGHGKGECPAGGGHDGNGSSDYILSKIAKS
ncbi:MAG: hypothetical protein WB511_01260 [Nitrososphaeraceae archaeon]